MFFSLFWVSQFSEYPVLSIRCYGWFTFPVGSSFCLTGASSLKNIFLLFIRARVSSLILVNVIFVRKANCYQRCVFFLEAKLGEFFLLIDLLDCCIYLGTVCTSCIRFLNVSELSVCTDIAIDRRNKIKSMSLLSVRQLAKSQTYVIMNLCTKRFAL